MREFDILANYPSPKKPRLVGKDLRSIKNRIIASYRDRDFFDGDRSNGYGGYKYDGRWKSIAESMVSEYQLKSGSRILHIGCEKGFLLSDLLDLNSQFDLYGLENSAYAINNSMEQVRDKIRFSDYRNLDFKNGFFDLVIAIGPVYTLNLGDGIGLLKEIQRVTKKNSFITLGSYEKEEDFWLFRDWTLLGTTVLKQAEWLEVLKHVGFTGDYKFNSAKSLNLSRMSD